MKKKKPAWWELPIPMVIPITHVRLAQERGFSPTAILAAAGLPTDYLEHPFDIRLFQMHGLLEAILRVLGDEGLGIDVGLRLPPTAFGNFGYALLCSETLRDVMNLCQKYWHLVARGTTLHIHEHDGVFIADVAPVAPLPHAHHRLAMETTFASVLRGFELLAPGCLHEVEAWFDFAAPAYAAKYATILPRVQFGKAANQLRFPARLLDVKLGMYNPTALKFALEQCERENSLSDFEDHEILTRVKHQVVFTGKGYPSLEQVSQQLNMTTRTLRRRLEAEGTTFKEMVEQAKRRDAIRLLDDARFPVHKIAELLGYNDPANFTRAFRSWTDQTPSEYRAARLPTLTT